jgi:hypothetical protein
MESKQFTFPRVQCYTKPKAQLTASYCPTCGHLLAASPYATLLDFIERIHICSESRAIAVVDSPRLKARKSGRRFLITSKGTPVRNLKRP